MNKNENISLLSWLIEKAQRYASINFRPIGPVDTDDLAQMAMIKFVRHQHHIRLPLTYLYRVINSVATDTTRHYARERAMVLPLNLNLSDACLVSESFEDNYQTNSHTPDEYSHKEMAEPDILPRVNTMFDRLPPIHREPLELFANGYSYEEISEKLQIPPGTVRSRIHHARKRAARMLADLH